MLIQETEDSCFMTVRSKIQSNIIFAKIVIEFNIFCIWLKKNVLQLSSFLHHQPPPSMIFQGSLSF